MVENKQLKEDIKVYTLAFKYFPQRTETLSKIWRMVHGREMTISEAWIELKSLKRPYETKEWKKIVSRKKKKHCESCGVRSGKKSVLVLQHINEKRFDYYHYIDTLKNVGKIDIVEIEKDIKNNLVITDKMRKKHLKENAKFFRGFDLDERFLNIRIDREIYQEQLRKAITKAEAKTPKMLSYSEIEKRGFWKYMESLYRYLSLIDTKTLCKKCKDAEDEIFIEFHKTGKTTLWKDVFKEGKV